jgi:hypothetical protein
MTIYRLYAYICIVSLLLFYPNPGSLYIHPYIALSISFFETKGTNLPRVIIMVVAERLRVIKSQGRDVWNEVKYSSICAGMAGGWILFVGESYFE